MADLFQRLPAGHGGRLPQEQPGETVRPRVRVQVGDESLCWFRVSVSIDSHTSHLPHSTHHPHDIIKQPFATFIFFLLFDSDNSHELSRSAKASMLICWS